MNLGQAIRTAKGRRRVHSSSRRGLRAAVLALAGLVAVGCGTGGLDNTSVGPGKGWPTAFHDAHNSATSPVTGSRQLILSWSRPIGGPVVNPTTVGADGQMFLTTTIDSDCVGNPGHNGAIFSFQILSGRKRFCNQLGAGARATASAVDGATNVYLGDDGGVDSFTALGQPRWRTPVAGVPVSAQFTGDGKVLTVTQLGQIDVLERQTGDRGVPTVQLLGEPDYLAHPDLPRPPDNQGLDDCATGGPRCPVANVSAVDQRTGRFYVTLWRPGTAVASLVALRYADREVRQDWSRDLLTKGSATSPALSADGTTVYLGDNDGQLIAVDAADGHPKWQRPLGFSPRGSISCDNGLLIPGGDEGHLIAVRDRGTTADIAWDRPDLPLRGRPAQAAGHTGYTVAAAGDVLELVTFDTRDGTTVASDVLPGAKGSTAGIAIGDRGEVVVTTHLGEVYAFKPQR